MNERLSRIRESERKSHTEIYTSEKLYNTDSWLQKPIKTVKDLLPFFENYKVLRVLDLGCGIGRNSIYIAEIFRDKCIIDCVDLLEIAIEKLSHNAKEHNVLSSINGIVKTIEEYEIPKNTYDLVMAVSALEHVDSETSFAKKLNGISEGMKDNGIVCLVINSNVTEVNSLTGEAVEAQFEVNLPTETLQSLLHSVFSDYKVIKNTVARQEYDIPRESYTSHLSTDVVTFVAMKCD